MHLLESWASSTLTSTEITADSSLRMHNTSLSKAWLPIRPRPTISAPERRPDLLYTSIEMTEVAERFLTLDPNQHTRDLSGRTYLVLVIPSPTAMLTERGTPEKSLLSPLGGTRVSPLTVSVIAKSATRAAARSTSFAHRNSSDGSIKLRWKIATSSGLSSRIIAWVASDPRKNDVSVLTRRGICMAASTPYTM